MTSEQENKCHVIIHTASAAAAGAGAGLAQIPGSDNAVIIPLQIGMILSLGTIFGIELSETTAKSTLATTAASTIGRGISQFLVGWMPVIGNVINATTAAGITETIGWTIAKDFDNKS
jgi:uncharacterized protein (DUF697 family)